MAKFWKRVFNFCLRVVLRIIWISYHGFLVVLFLGRKRVVPPIKDPILLKSAVTLAAEIREGKVKSEDVITAYIERILIVNPFINAICDQCFNEALEKARKVDQLISSHTKTPQQLEEETPLLGIPFTVKLLISVKGMSCNAGSLLHKERKAYKDAEVINLMKKAGAICLAVTNSPEFGFSFETYNSIYGRTSNPYDTTRTSGGSSGGEGALLGSGGSLIGIGNDLCGSVRHPGNFNGIFGHKSTAGLISNEGTFPVPGPRTEKYLVTGPMCRYADDLALTTRILCGAKTTEINLSVPVNFSKVKFYYCMLDSKNPCVKAVSSDVKNAILKVVDHVQSVHSVEAKEVDLTEIQQGFAIFIHILMASLEKELKDIFSGEESELNPTEELFKTMFFQSKLTIGPAFSMNLKKIPLIYSEHKLPKIREQLQKLQKKLNTILDKDSLLIMPGFPIPAHYHYESIPLLKSVGYMGIFNILGNPVTQCPVGLNENKLPLGFQIVGTKGQDHLTIAFAKEMEKSFGGWVPPNSKE